MATMNVVVVVVEVIVLWLCRKGGGCPEVELLGAWRRMWRGSQLANKTLGPATAVASPGTLYSKCQGCQAQASQQSMRCHKPASKITEHHVCTCMYVCVCVGLMWSLFLIKHLCYLIGSLLWQALYLVKNAHQKRYRVSQYAQNVDTILGSLVRTIGKGLCWLVKERERERLNLLFDLLQLLHLKVSILKLEIQ